jgi:hypothetical protein
MDKKELYRKRIEDIDKRNDEIQEAMEEHEGKPEDDQDSSR